MLLIVAFVIVSVTLRLASFPLARAYCYLHPLLPTYAFVLLVDIVMFALVFPYIVSCMLLLLHFITHLSSALVCVVAVALLALLVVHCSQRQLLLVHFHSLSCL